MVGYGARPNEVLDRLTSAPSTQTIHVRGNHDRVCCGLTSSHGFNPIAAEAAAWTKAHLTPQHLEWLRLVPQGPLLPPQQATARAMCAHGSPLHEDQYIVSMRDAWGPLQRMATEITFFGHTHVQGGFSQQEQEWEEDKPVYANSEGLGSFVVEVPAGSRHLMNPGSVGQPRDGDWRAAFAIYDDAPEGGVETVTFHRVPYDLEAAQAAIRAARLPERLAARLKMGR
jgi:diadenosine tetraphosphatase ApaH/serine/threonine PP2A family protein phosphatase